MDVSVSCVVAVMAAGKMKQLGIFIACLIGAVFVILSFRDWFITKTKCHNFIALWNPGQADEITRAVMKYEFFFPAELLTALLYVESAFDPNAVGPCGEKGIGQLTEDAVLEIERIYKTEVDRERLFEIDYNIEQVGLFLSICKDRAGPYSPNLPINQRTVMVYHDWLTWDFGTYQYADQILDIRADIERI